MKKLGGDSGGSFLNFPGEGSCFYGEGVCFCGESICCSHGTCAYFHGEATCLYGQEVTLVGHRRSRVLQLLHMHQSEFAEKIEIKVKF